MSQCKLIRQLRDAETVGERLGLDPDIGSLAKAAADEIERLRAALDEEKHKVNTLTCEEENKRLRAIILSYATEKSQAIADEDKVCQAGCLCGLDEALRAADETTA